LIFAAAPLIDVDSRFKLASVLYASGMTCVCSALTVSLLEFSSRAKLVSALYASGMTCVCSALKVSLLEFSSGPNRRLACSVLATMVASRLSLAASVCVTCCRLPTDRLSDVTVFSSSTVWSRAVTTWTFAFTRLIIVSRLTELDGAQRNFG
jgi:hypothetical protein